MEPAGPPALVVVLLFVLHLVLHPGETLQHPLGLRPLPLHLFLQPLVFSLYLKIKDFYRSLLLRHEYIDFLTLFYTHGLWFRDSCFICAGSSARQVFPLNTLSNGWRLCCHIEGGGLLVVGGGDSLMTQSAGSVTTQSIAFKPNHTETGYGRFAKR